MGWLVNEIFSSQAEKSFEPWVEQLEFIISTLQKVRFPGWKVSMVCLVKNHFFFLLLDVFRDHEKFLMFILLKLFSLYLCLTSQMKQYKKWQQIQISNFPSENTLISEIFFHHRNFQENKSFQYKRNNLPSLRSVLAKQFRPVVFNNSDLSTTSCINIIYVNPENVSQPIKDKCCFYLHLFPPWKKSQLSPCVLGKKK